MKFHGIHRILSANLLEFRSSFSTYELSNLISPNRLMTSAGFHPAAILAAQQMGITIAELGELTVGELAEFGLGGQNAADDSSVKREAKGLDKENHSCIPGSRNDYSSISTSNIVAEDRIYDSIGWQIDDEAAIEDVDKWYAEVISTLEHINRHGIHVLWDANTAENTLPIDMKAVILNRDPDARRESTRKMVHTVGFTGMHDLSHDACLRACSCEQLIITKVKSHTWRVICDAKMPKLDARGLIPWSLRRCYVSQHTICENIGFGDP